MITLPVSPYELDRTASSHFCCRTHRHIITAFSHIASDGIGFESSICDWGVVSEFSSYLVDTFLGGVFIWVPSVD